MKKILLTGATGNVGRAILRQLQLEDQVVQIAAGVRQQDTPHPLLKELEVPTILFDFLSMDTVMEALTWCDILFLLRPPELVNVKEIFQPIIQGAVEKKVEHIVFLSVQGAERSSYIPHYKIETLIRESGIPYTFLRPAYFMQNFLTTLRSDLVEQNRIFLPAGKALFTIVDVEDIGAVAAKVLLHPTDHQNKAYELTNSEQLSFQDMANILSRVLGKDIVYKSPNLLRFYLIQRTKRHSSTFILVMIMLHYIPRFQPVPKTTDWVEKLTRRSPVSFEDFVKQHQAVWLPVQ